MVSRGIFHPAKHLVSEVIRHPQLSKEENARTILPNSKNLNKKTLSEKLNETPKNLNAKKLEYKKKNILKKTKNKEIEKEKIEKEPLASVGAEAASLTYRLCNIYTTESTTKDQKIRSTFKEVFSSVYGVGGAVIGQAIIPIPVVGRLIGGFIGNMFGSVVGGRLYL